MEEEFKIKPLTKSQIKFFLDRLTRFKSTEDKYLRVFKEIIISNLIYPKYTKKKLDLMDYDELKNITENIFNLSIRALNSSSCHAELVDKGNCRIKEAYVPVCFSSASYRCSLLDRSRNKFWMTNAGISGDFSINKKLLEYEKSVFIFDENVEKLLRNKIDYKSAVTLFNDKDLAFNLKWLKSLADNVNQIENRVNLGLKFPLEKIIIVEGITEEILLPKFAKLCGCDFDKEGINLIAAGGKNPVVKLFYKFADILKLPVFILLDSDAEESFNLIKHKLRENDRVYVLKSGEFEDILPLNLIKRTLNRYFRNYFSVKLEDLRKDMPMVQILTELFREKGLEFKKAEFASLIGGNIRDLKDISEEIKEIISSLTNNK